MLEGCSDGRWRVTSQVALRSNTLRQHSEAILLPAVLLPAVLTPAVLMPAVLMPTLRPALLLSAWSKLHETD